MVCIKMFFRTRKNKSKPLPSRGGSPGFLWVLALVLAVFFVAEAPLQVLASNGSLSIVYHGEPSGTNTIVFVDGERIPLAKISNQTLAGVETIMISVGRSLNLSMPVILDEILECNSTMIIVYPSSSRPEAMIRDCTTVSESLAYITLVLPGVGKEDLAENKAEAGIVRNDSVLRFSSKLVIMSLKNSTISLPPAKCNSPDELLLRNGDYVFFVATTRDNRTYALVMKIVLPCHPEESNTLSLPVNNTLSPAQGGAGAPPENVVITTSLPAYGVKERRDPYTIVFSAMIVAGALILVTRAVRKPGS